MDLSALSLSIRLRNRLQRAGITTLAQLRALADAEIDALRPSDVERSELVKLRSACPCCERPWPSARGRGRPQKFDLAVAQTMHDDDGLSYAEIARQLGVSPAAVRQRLIRPRDSERSA